MDTQSLRALKYRENDGASKNVLASAITLKKYFRKLHFKMYCCALKG